MTGDGSCGAGEEADDTMTVTFDDLAPGQTKRQANGIVVARSKDGRRAYWAHGGLNFGIDLCTFGRGHDAPDGDV